MSSLYSCAGHVGVRCTTFNAHPAHLHIGDPDEKLAVLHGFDGRKGVANSERDDAGDSVGAAHGKRLATARLCAMNMHMI